MSKRVYKFLSTPHALSNLQEHRIKISKMEELNDPFDLFALDSTHPTVRNVSEAFSLWFRDKIGLLCFSRNWDNILLWSHYGCSHTGVCLGFDVLDTGPEGNYALDVSYQPAPLTIRSEDEAELAFGYELIKTKYEVWSYEQEVRMIVELRDPPDENGMHWFPFGDNLELTEVIVGAQCAPQDSKNIARAHSAYSDTVQLSWAGLRRDAFALQRLGNPPDWRS